MRKLLFIYNPRAGKGLIRNNLSYILEAFAKSDMEVTVRPTQRSHHACDIMIERGRDFDMVVCCGGDGTLDEVVTGMMRGGFTVPIGYIPAGSTNDFANSLGIPKQMQKAAKAIANGQVYSIDVGTMNESHYFVYVAAFGAISEVSYETNQDMKNMLGHLAYVIEGARRIPNMKSWHLKVESEEYSTEGDFLLGMVTNSNSVGGFKSISYGDVTLNDGLFEVTLIKKPESPLDWASIFNAMVLGLPNDKVITFKTRHLVFSGDEEMAWTTDGEFGGKFTTCEIDNRQCALKLVLGEVPDDMIDEDEDYEEHDFEDRSTVTL